MSTGRCQDSGREGGEDTYAEYCGVEFFRAWNVGYWYFGPGDHIELEEVSLIQNLGRRRLPFEMVERSSLLLR